MKFRYQIGKFLNFVKKPFILGFFLTTRQQKEGDPCIKYINMIVKKKDVKKCNVFKI